MDKIKINDNLHLNNIYTDKFKNSSVSFQLFRPLDKSEVTLNALLVNVLNRGCNMLKTQSEISKYLENLYGADIYCGISKKGDAQVMYFTVKFLNDRFLPENENVQYKAVKLLMELLYSPYIVENGFLSEYVEQEKANLKNYIQSLINDKRAYALHRCISAMCEGEPYGLTSHGIYEDVDAITPEELYSHYKKIINDSHIDIISIGSCETDITIDVLSQYLGNVNAVSYPKIAIHVNKRDDILKITDNMDVNQGKISLGFTTGISPVSDDLCAIRMYSSILGGGAHSKLFANVREKMSLCYYASSKVDVHKGIICISSGIEFANFDTAYNAILEQVNDMKLGNISDNEFDAARKSLINVFTETEDSVYYLQEYYLNRILVGDNTTPAQMIKKIKNVTKEDVIRVAQNVKLDTVYFLKGNEN